MKLVTFRLPLASLWVLNSKEKFEIAISDHFQMINY